MNTLPSRAPRVILAALFLVLLITSLMWRVSATTAAGSTPSEGSTASAASGHLATEVALPAGSVPAPMSPVLGDLDIPCWSCAEARGWSVASRVDLDLIAPLGDGDANAAEWIVPLAIKGGSRVEEVETLAKEWFEKSGNKRWMVPADHPLLVEAEAWVDQSRLQFYDGLLPIRGEDTPIPNLILLLNISKSWVARGQQATSSETAKADFRRAVRLGRLLRQEDVTIIGDLVGIAAIRYGTQAIFDLATEEGDLETALVASLVLGELGPQRFLTSAKITEVDLNPNGTEILTPFVVSAKDVDRLIVTATEDPDRRFRSEAVIKLGYVFHLGTEPQRARVSEVLETIKAEGDPILAAHAGWSLDHKPSDES